MEKVRLGDVCTKASSNIAQKDLDDRCGNFPIYGASGFIKNVDFYKQEKEYIAVVKDGAGVGRIIKCPAKSSVIGTMQYILPNENVNVDFLAFAMENMNLSKYYSGATIPHIYYKDYCKETLFLPSIVEQKQIVKILNKVTGLINKRKQQLSQLDELVKSRFVEMFGEPRINPLHFPKRMLKDTCKVVTGNTPSRAVSEYYGDYVEWIKTDNIVSELLNPTEATEYLSEEGMKVGRTVEKDSILMACIAGSLASIGRVCVTDRKVAFNQQINAVIPDKYNILFLYVMFQLSKDYLVEEINMALKGILSKSKLEEKEFFVPPMELQEQFADFVKQTYKLKFEIQQSLEKLETLKKSLMQKYFGRGENLESRRKYNN